MPDPAPTAVTDAGSDGTITLGDADTETDAKPKTCPADLPGPRMVQIDPSDGQSYCIDTTKVTQGQYFAFMKTFETGVGVYSEDALKLAAASLPKGCPERLRLQPGKISSPPCDSTPEAFDFQGKHPDYPVTCVTGCTAFAYCKWAGKRLCGRIGGGTLEKQDLSDAKASQWYHACSQGGETAYSYGNDFEEQRCNGAYAWSPVDSESTCRGLAPPFDQIVGLSEWPAEWQDGCVFGTALGCYFQSYRQDYVGSDLRVADDPSCSDAFLGRAQSYALDIGFRCCLDL